MQEVISFGKRLVPLEQIAYVEPFNPAQNPQLNATKEFKARVVLLNRDDARADRRVHAIAAADVAPHPPTDRARGAVAGLAMSSGSPDVPSDLAFGKLKGEFREIRGDAACRR
jgi:hypothetical protein